jgi:hypothetical protein
MRSNKRNVIGALIVEMHDPNAGDAVVAVNFWCVGRRVITNALSMLRARIIFPQPDFEMAS